VYGVAQHARTLIIQLSCLLVLLSGHCFN